MEVPQLTSSLPGSGGVVVAAARGATAPPEASWGSWAKAAASASSRGSESRSAFAGGGLGVLFIGKTKKPWDCL